jgi:hypothetical protein
MRRLAARMAALESGPQRMVIAKLPEGEDVHALLACHGIALRPSDLLVRINRPEGCGGDFARVVETVQ